MQPKLGSGARFAAVEKSAAASGARDPAAVAAAVGRAKYGKAKFQALAEKGRERTDQNPGGKIPPAPVNPPAEGTGIGPVPHLRTPIGVPDVLSSGPPAVHLGSKLLGKGPKLIVLHR